MGLFDRLLGSRSSGAQPSGNAAAAANSKPEAYFLDPDASTSLGDVKFMRRSNTIRHTFPGTADSPGDKEMVAEVASMEAKLEKMSPGLAGISPDVDVSIDLTGGVPKPVKKTFAKQMSSAELEQRLKGSAVVGVNVPGGAAAARMARASEADATTGGTPQTERAGAIDPFKAMAKEING